MATTTPDPRLVVKTWSKTLWRDVMAESYWSKFMGNGMNNVIQIFTDIKGKSKGDKITIPLIYRLEGEGVRDCNTLVGNEEEMVEDAMSVTIGMLRHGVRMECEYHDWIHLYDMREKAKELLRLWWTERDDKEMFAVLAGKAATGHANGNPALPPSNLRLVDRSSVDLDGDMILNDLIKMKEMARMARPKIRPIRVDGSDHYVCVLHPYVARVLRMSAAWKQLQSTANERGSSNPLFRGSLGTYDGVVIHEHEHVYLEGTSPNFVASNLFLGQQAGVLVQSKDTFWREDHTVDYGRQVGIATGKIYGVRKSRFEDGYSSEGAQDYGMITYLTKAAPAA